VPPLEVWEKVLVDGEAYPATVHGQIPCTDCHGGTQLETKDEAHQGVIRNPSASPNEFCDSCHPNLVTFHEDSLHSNLAGYWQVLEERSTPEDHPILDEMFGNHCSNCHATCGECHVSQPDLVGGGFIEGHVFNREPSMTRNCAACHGSRVGNEYLGKHEDLKADVHFREGRMTCVDCHTGNEMHGQLSDCKTCHTEPEELSVSTPNHRYEGVQTPRCETCHITTTIGDGIEMHEAHGADLSCQVCHSVAYTSCDGCHVQISDKTGNPLFATDSSYLGLYIGRNPLKSFDRPYDFVPLRHVPISQTSFQFYGENLLSNFDALPTWVYTTPHNIQLETPQTESCNSCHGNPDIFLTPDKVLPGELTANQGVVVYKIPSKIVDRTTPTPTKEVNPEP